MNEEIKEILAYFEEYVKITDMHDSEPMLNWKDLKIVLDYITNLQQELERYKHYSKTTGIEELMAENERLKERVAYLERSNNRREDTIIGLRFEVAEQEDYKSRCEKAIEYIKENNCPDPYCLTDDLLNILQNGSDSQ